MSEDARGGVCVSVTGRFLGGICLNEVQVTCMFAVCGSRVTEGVIMSCPGVGRLCYKHAVYAWVSLITRNAKQTDGREDMFFLAA